MLATLIVTGLLATATMVSSAAQTSCDVTFNNQGAYTLKVSQSPVHANDKHWSVDILSGQHRTHDVLLNSDINLQAVLGKHKTCGAPKTLCGQSVNCTGTSILGFHCDCHH